MNQLIAKSSTLTMSSREIADLVEKRHDNVKRTIETLAESGIIQFPQTEEIQTATKPALHYVFSGEKGKRDSIIVVAQLSPEFTARLVDRWQELETKSAAPALPNFADPVAAARAWADAKEAEQKAIALLEEAKPAVEFVQKYTEADGAKGFREVCKLLKANEARFREFVIEKQVMYRLSGKLMPYANHLDAGRFTILTGINGDNAYTTAKFTSKGVAWIAGEWAKYNLPQEIGGNQ